MTYEEHTFLVLNTVESHNDFKHTTSPASLLHTHTNTHTLIDHTRETPTSFRHV